MENITNTLVTTAIFDEKRTHRYLLTKTWDSEETNTYNHHDVSAL